MTRLKSTFASVLLVCALAVLAVPAFAQTAVTQLPTTCVAGTLYSYTPPSGPYSSATLPGTYLCLAGNVIAPFSGGGASQQLLLTDFSNTTATAATFISYPVLASTNYTFSCDVFWQNSGTNAITFTITTPASPTSILAYGEVNYNAAGARTDAPFSGSPLAFTSTAAGVGATTYRAVITGAIQNGTTAGTLAFQASAGTGTTTLKAGSNCTVKSNP